MPDFETEKIKAEKFKKMQKELLKKEVKQLEIKVDDENFEKEVIKKSWSTPVVTDFWASWCMPCLMLGPILEKFAKELEGKFVLAKVNVDETRAASEKYEISSIPAIKMFKNGKVVDEFIGVLPKEMIRDWLKKNL